MPVNHDGKDDPCFAYTLWRRTLLNQDERAWCVVYADYQRQVCFWIKRQLRFVVDETTMQTLVDDAFVKMAGTFSRHPEKFADYPNVAALLGLLRLSRSGWCRIMSPPHNRQCRSYHSMPLTNHALRRPRPLLTSGAC